MGGALPSRPYLLGLPSRQGLGVLPLSWCSGLRGGWHDAARARFLSPGQLLTLRSGLDGWAKHILHLLWSSAARLPPFPMPAAFQDLLYIGGGGLVL